LEACQVEKDYILTILEGAQEFDLHGYQDIFNCQLG